MKNLGNTVTKESLLCMATIKRQYIEICQEIHALEHKKILCDKEMEMLRNANIRKNELASWIPEINRFTDDVINQDKNYYKKLSSYKFDQTTLNYCIA